MHRTRRFPLTIIVLLVALLAMPGSSALGQTPSASFGLYVSMDSAPTYTRIHPTLLDDVPDAEPITFDHEHPNFAISADGSTYASLDEESPRTVTIYDGFGGTERLTIPLKSQAHIEHISMNGSLITLAEPLMCGPSRCSARTWHSFETTSGDLVSTLISDDGEPAWPNNYSPDGTRLYEALVEPTGPGPWSLQIAAHNLETGNEVTRVTVPDVLAGNWQGSSLDGMYVAEFERPAIVLSPDGTTLAVIDAGMETLTLIETATMTVTETLPITRQAANPSLMTRFLRWLGIIPQSAEAKMGGDGRSLNAIWTPDGRSLYVTGYETSLDRETEKLSGTALGIIQLDAQTGQILGDRGFEGVNVMSMLISPDGTSLYAVTDEHPSWETQTTEGYRLNRFDLLVGDLNPRSVRDFDAWPQLIFLPNP